MPTVTVTKALKDYFNDGDGLSVESQGGDICPATVDGIPPKRAAKDFLTELRALSVQEKRELAEGVCEITGDTLS